MIAAMPPGVDSLGWRAKIAVLVPATNTVVQPDFDAMRPAGVTNHVSRIRIPNLALRDDADFERLLGLIATAQDDALDSVLACEPQLVVLGITAESFWSGLEGSRALKARLEQRAGVPVILGSDACLAALACLDARRIAMLTPYQPGADARVAQLLAQAGVQVLRQTSLRCASPLAIAQVSQSTLVQELKKLDGDDLDAIVQIGTNLPALRLAASAEVWLGKPVLSINAMLYWHALRSLGITDPASGFGPLLERF